ncbi:MAG: flavin reductase family protein [Acidimicrobiales bacterium]
MSEAGKIDPAEFRSTLGHFPTGVTVVTGMAGDQPVGMTIGSFTSVSLEPALVAWLPTRDSATWAQIKASGSFCANILSAHQGDVCGVFASRSEDKFADVAWRAAGSGSPIIEGSLGWIDCDIDAIHPAGDHDIVVGAVRSLAVSGADDGPLVFFKGALGTFDAH